MAKQIKEEQIDLLVERLVDRVEKANEVFLKNIGEHIKKLKEVSPSKAQQLIQILKYGESYENIVKKIQKYTNLNVNDIDEMFNAYAKKDQQFYKEFYDYRNKPFIPFEKNVLLKQQTQAFSNMVKNEMYNFTRSNVLGYSINGKFLGLREVYNDLLDTAFVNVGQGKETFDSAMFGILNQVGTSGLKTLQYESGRSIRLDSAIRMHLKGRLRELHNENQKIIGDEIGADGVEISVHENPAPDHELVQGRQFSLQQYEILNNGLLANDYKGHKYTLDHDGKNGYRPISEMNCYHYIFSIVLGVSKPEYSDEELKQIINDNDEGFDYEGKHYTNYEGTQLQRRLETEIRKQKDNQILARASDNKDLIAKSQQNINILTNKYKELSKASNLPMKMDRLRVSGYQRVKSNVLQRIDNVKSKGIVGSISEKVDKTVPKRDFDSWKQHFKDKDIYISDDLKTIDEDLRERNISYLDYLTDKYNVARNQNLIVGTENTHYMGVTYYRQNTINLSTKYFNDKDKLVNAEKRGQASNWHMKVKEENLDLYTLTHEYGHAVENDYTRRYLKRVRGIDTNVRQNFITRTEKKLREEVDQDIRNALFDTIRRKENLSITEIKNKYFSDYAKSKRHYEWFAETFSQLELGEKNALTEAMKEWLERNF